MICYRSDVSRLEAEEENVATATLPLGAGGRCRSNNIEAKFKGYKVVVGVKTHLSAAHLCDFLNFLAGR